MELCKSSATGFMDLSLMCNNLKSCLLANSNHGLSPIYDKQKIDLVNKIYTCFMLGVKDNHEVLNSVLC